jgi:hypothetical protein
VACESSIPSFNNSQWMRGAPRRRLAKLIVRIRSRTSPVITGGVSRFRLFHFRKSRKPFRCQAMAVSGLTTSSAARPSAHRWES